MDLNIEENTLKYQNVNVPTEYNISEGIEYYLYTSISTSISIYNLGRVGY